MSTPDVVASAVVHESLAGRAYGQLKRSIIQCELAPGRRVTEGELVQMIGIGKTPVREALNRLVSDGLVRSLPRHGYVITPITLRDVHDLFDVRTVVEPAAARMAAGRVDGDRLEHLDRLCQAAYQLESRDSATRFLAANYELHATIADASGNSRLATIVRSILIDCERLFHLGLMVRNRSEEIAHEHHELVDALVQNNADLASAITAEQIEAARRMVVDALATSASILAMPIDITSDQD